MGRTARLQEKINKRTARARILGIEERVSLICSELGTNTTGRIHYPPSSKGGGYFSTIDKSVAKYRNLEINLEVISCTEEFEDHTGNRTTQIYTKRRSLLLPLLYCFKLVYASEMQLKEPVTLKVSVFKDGLDWLLWLENRYSEAKLEKAIKENKSLTEKIAADLEQREKGKQGAYIG